MRHRGSGGQAERGESSLHMVLKDFLVVLETAPDHSACANVVGYSVSFVALSRTTTVDAEL